MVEFLGIRPPSQFPAERRAQIAESVRRDPELSDREHRRRIGVDHKTVAAVRRPVAARHSLRVLAV